ncbi:MAG: hypothetical protein D6709_02645 [Chloroflexi bacterium]|jgi:hypothetical protein|uniref:Uncharacterized protein n=1 Tax=Candidatus Thermofonsia Clade 3 bacterium TaxID=2364212 RepID=A0A2M8QA10_9CHLR|nr:MAG: hypothetical protein CUN48_12690 [Candidatus Thermofonsia Clade 3 bacterium]RMG65432.1 MAG: hypothetical protein D6709_02645 [Chloroflexota bacterium]
MLGMITHLRRLVSSNVSWFLLFARMLSTGIDPSATEANTAADQSALPRFEMHPLLSRLSGKMVV